jgi:hypothetical protein
MSQLALLGSVFLPASVFRPLADELRRRGHRVLIAAPGVAATPDEALDGYVAALAGLDEAGPTIGVAHSNAGTYVPALVARGCLDAAVFMDAVLPDTDGGAVPVVREDLRDGLRDMVVEGALPPWTEWWPPDDVRALFPDQHTFEAVRRATPRVPGGYLDGTVEVPEAWTAGFPGAFLAFGGTYADEQRRAAALGWPTRTLDLGHLGQLQDPAGVAGALLELIE